LKKLRNEKASLERKNEDQGREMEKMRRTLIQLRKEMKFIDKIDHTTIDSLKQELSQTTAKSESDLIEWTTKLEVLKSQRNQCDSDNADLKTRISILTQDCESQHSKFDEIREDHRRQIKQIHSTCRKDMASLRSECDA